ncbi:hypothetical protein DBR00_05935 [Pseudomonas sp. HMWF032]|uniref:PA4575 family protein n=1 Tax=unclassified Pseudomonas TaxID=196821 RepID=UPI000D33334F|nr:MULTISPECIES: hypothetical protein [unclassified Pseudomonas]PTS85325.1 hypothetical protein DBR00_05935 [Pseudomonas sp. HMWF032]PTT84789.1 hypothetical protein DBR41_06335 [Pseudomonas sp. HMWF010]WAC46662.1 hypothetical protein OU997_11770 [Pseudomonas sp. SL4(2022)]
MSRNLNLTRHCLGLDTRIECAVLPLAGNNGLWTLICAAGMSGSQPSAIKAQGPFHGACEAESILADIADNLRGMGYEPCVDVPIWRLHIQARLRQLNGERGHPLSHCQFRPET